MASLDEDLAAMCGVLGLHAGDAVVLYESDFAASVVQGRSRGPRGRGPLCADVDVMVPFHYRVVVETLPDGLRVARFPTAREQPGGGPGYSWFSAYACGRGAVLRAPTVWGFTVVLPRPVELAERCRHHENRFVLSVGREDKENLVGLRFDGPDELVWVRGSDARAAGGASLDRLPLGARLVGGERLRFTVGVDRDRGVVAASVRCSAPDVDVGSVCPVAVDLARADCVVVAPAGNALSSDTDAALFARLASIVVVGPAR
jgi:hypothetical protein